MKSWVQPNEHTVLSELLESGNDLFFTKMKLSMYEHLPLKMLFRPQKINVMFVVT